MEPYRVPQNNTGFSMTKRRLKTVKPAHAALTMTVEAAARELGVSRGTAYECAKSGQIPTIRLGRRLLVPVESLRRMINGEIPQREVKAGGR